MAESRSYAQLTRPPANSARGECGEQGLECRLVGSDEWGCLRGEQHGFEEPVVRLRTGGRWLLKIVEASIARTGSTVARNLTGSTWCTHGLSIDAQRS